MTSNEHASALLRLQNRLATALGVDPVRRADIVAAMMSERGMGSAAYWLLLLVASGIATLGLSLDSTGVVIGAMLVSPLMTPIVSFGTALSIGSSWLLMRAGLRLLASCLVVPAFAALVTSLLPYQVITSEIAARTSPTLIDLNVAILCGLIAAFATAREASDTATAASGTAIAIALVPPLCAVGFGWGAGDPDVARGAALLFLANMAAIVAVTSLLFTGLGFGRVSTFALEDAAMQQAAPWQRRLTTRGRRIMGGRRAWARLIVPLVVIVPLYFPLRIALDAVALQVRRSTAISAALSDYTGEVVATHSEVRGDQVRVWVTMVGSRVDGEAAQLQIHDELRTALGEEPQVVVRALRNADAIAAAPAVPAASVPTPAPELRELFEDLGDDIDAALATLRPEVPATWRLDIRPEAAQLEVEVEPPLDDDEAARLATLVSEAGGPAVQVRRVPPPVSRFDLEQSRAHVASVLGERWPSSLGPVPSWRVGFDARGVTLELVRRANSPLPREVLAMLSQSLGEALGLALEVRERFVPITIARFGEGDRPDVDMIIADAGVAITAGFAVRLELGTDAPAAARRVAQRACESDTRLTCGDVEGEVVTVSTEAPAVAGDAPQPP